MGRPRVPRAMRAEPPARWQCCVGALMLPPADRAADGAETVSSLMQLAALCACGPRQALHLAGCTLWSPAPCVTQEGSSDPLSTARVPSHPVLLETPTKKERQKNLLACPALRPHSRRQACSEAALPGSKLCLGAARLSGSPSSHRGQHVQGGWGEPAMPRHHARLAGAGNPAERGRRTTKQTCCAESGQPAPWLSRPRTPLPGATCSGWPHPVLPAWQL